MLRPKVAIGLAVSIVLVIVLLGGLHHGGHITLPLEKVKEAASDVIGWEDIEMPHNEFTPEMTEETPEIPQLEESSGPDVRNETSSQAADFLEDPSVLESAESPPLSTPTSTDLSNAEPEQELPEQTSTASLLASSLDVNPIDDSAVRIYIGVVPSSPHFVLTTGNGMVELRPPIPPPRSLQTLHTRRPRHSNPALRPW